MANCRSPTLNCGFTAMNICSPTVNGGFSGRMRGISSLPRNFIWHTSKLCSTMAEYTMQEMNDLNNEGKTLLHPRMIIRHCCDSDELSALTAEGTTFSAGEVRGVMHLLFRMMARRMFGQHRWSRGVFSPTRPEGGARARADGRPRTAEECRKHRGGRHQLQA